MNYALHKKIIESNVAKAETATNGVTTGYTGNTGFAYFLYPGTLTVDLENIFLIKCIRFLLWDGLGTGGNKPDKRRYKYNLQVSQDNYHFKTVHTTADEGTIGWQIFYFENAIKIRYIRIHGIFNTANKGFHIVEIEAHDEKPPKPEGHIGREENIENQMGSLELTNSTNIPPKINSNEINNIISVLKNSRLFNDDLIKRIETSFNDLIVLDQNINAVRSQIIEPVKNEMQKSNKLALFALILTIIGLVLTLLFSSSSTKFIAWLWNILK